MVERGSFLMFGAGFLLRLRPCYLDCGGVIYHSFCPVSSLELKIDIEP